MRPERPAGWLSRPELPLFILFGLYIRLYLDPQVLYDAYGVAIPYPTFRTGWAFFARETLKPGGVTEYLSAYLSHGFHSSWVGTITITLTAALIWRCTASLINTAARVRAPWLALAPVMLLLAAFSSYEHPLARYDNYLGPFTASLALMVALICTAGYARTRRPVPFFVLGVVAHVLGGGAGIVFAVLCSLLEILNRRWLVSAAVLLVGLLIPYAMSIYLFDIIAADGCTRLLPMSYWTKPSAYPFAVGMYVVVPAVMLLATVAVSLSRRGLLPSVGAAQVPSLLGMAARAVLPILIGMLTVFATYDSLRSSFLKTAHLARHQSWSLLTETVRGLPAAGFEHPFFHRETLRALYHSGRLGYDLLSFAHSANAPTVPFLSLPPERDPQLWDHAQIAQLALELGDINRAEHFLHELLEGAGEAPKTVEKLALVNLVKGQIQTARVFLNARRQYLGQEDDADQMLQRLDRDPELRSDERIEYLRSAMFVEDDVRFIEHEPDRAESVRTLLALLERNPSNRMAFEYLMTRYLLNGQVEQIVENVKRFSDLGYREIPQLYEEAIVVHEFATSAAVDLGTGLEVNQATRRRFEAFKIASRRFRSNLRGAQTALAPEFGSSFFYYRTFGKTGV